MINDTENATVIVSKQSHLENATNKQINFQFDVTLVAKDDVPSVKVKKIKELHVGQTLDIKGQATIVLIRRTNNVNKNIMLTMIRSIAMMVIFSCCNVHYHSLYYIYFFFIYNRFGRWCRISSNKYEAGNNTIDIKSICFLLWGIFCPLENSLVIFFAPIQIASVFVLLNLRTAILPNASSNLRKLTVILLSLFKPQWWKTTKKIHGMGEEMQIRSADIFHWIV